MRGAGQRVVSADVRPTGAAFAAAFVASLPSDRWSAYVYVGVLTLAWEDEPRDDVVTVTLPHAGCVRGLCCGVLLRDVPCRGSNRAPLCAGEAERKSRAVSMSRSNQLKSRAKLKHG